MCVCVSVCVYVRVCVHVWCVCVCVHVCVCISAVHLQKFHHRLDFTDFECFKSACSYCPSKNVEIFPPTLEI